MRLIKDFKTLKKGDKILWDNGEEKWVGYVKEDPYSSRVRIVDYNLGHRRNDIKIGDRNEYIYDFKELKGYVERKVFIYKITEKENRKYMDILLVHDI